MATQQAPQLETERPVSYTHPEPTRLHKVSRMPSSA